MLPDLCGCVVLRLVLLSRPFGCTLLPGALWRAGPRWRRNTRSRVASVVCGRCGEWTVAWGAEVDGLEDPEVVELCGAPAPDGARTRTFVAPLGAVARDRGCVVMVAVLRVEVEELWCRASPVIILVTAALPYVPGCGGGNSGCFPRRAIGKSLRGRGIPLQVR